jgi:hypothetical protein
MTNSAADDPYLGVVSEFDAATAPRPTHQSALLHFLARVVRNGALAYRREHRRRRRAGDGHGGASASSVGEPDSSLQEVTRSAAYPRPQP